MHHIDPDFKLSSAYYNVTYYKQSQFKLGLEARSGRFINIIYYMFVTKVLHQD